MLLHLNWSAAWLAVPFATAIVFMTTLVIVTVVNNWQRSVPVSRVAPNGREPMVTVLIPTYGEPPAMLERTARSVLLQDWPLERLRVIVSDDAHSPAIAAVVTTLQQAFPATTLVYHEPPPRDAPQRQGEAKAGNLNSALQFVRNHFRDVPFIETRDADDEVGDPRFLRHCVGQLQADGRAAFVQTIKDAHVSPGDPFDNRATGFYHHLMLAKHAANAMFPCGSGLLWRTAALEDIGGFPTWNLVEDLQSGVEALRRGWRGVYVPIVGAIGQIAPEDLLSVYKQRGTWALDSVRLLLWGRLRGLSLRQRLHFFETCVFYFQGLAIVTIIAVVSIRLTFGIDALATDPLSYATHLWPFTATVELYLAICNGWRSYPQLWRTRQIQVGLLLVFTKACVLALLYGPHRKPTYQVTRKVHQVRWYWRETLPQAGLASLLVLALAYALATNALGDLELSSVFWALVLIGLLGSFLTKSWHGLDWRRSLRTLLRTAEPKGIAPPAPHASTDQAAAPRA